ncbi:MAG: hypothetical protein AAF738_03140, partial [Bacteroidota bacterium]
VETPHEILESEPLVAQVYPNPKGIIQPREKEGVFFEERFFEGNPFDTPFFEQPFFGKIPLPIDTLRQKTRPIEEGKKRIITRI